jgi:hypothetical protein
MYSLIDLFQNYVVYILHMEGMCNFCLYIGNILYL